MMMDVMVTTLLRNAFLLVVDVVDDVVIPELAKSSEGVVDTVRLTM